MRNRTEPTREAKAEVAVGPVEINGTLVRPGTRVTIDLPVARLYTHTDLHMPVHIVHGTRPGPRLFISAAIHGDELNGVEIIRRLLRHGSLPRLRGTLFAIPIVNVHGFLDRSRYLPDRRDLNRSFPGSGRGSLTARVADLFMKEIVSQCSHGIDLHTGALHRENLPQIRANLDDPDTADLARVFGVPVLINADLRDGSLRQAAAEQGIRMLLYEAGEALRFDELAIRAGLRGILRVMRSLGMLPSKSRVPQEKRQPLVARASSWIRAPESGILRTTVRLGARVEKGQVLGYIGAPFGDVEYEVEAPANGIVIGRTRLPLVHEGEAVYHLARFNKIDVVAERVEAFHARLAPSDSEEPEGEAPLV